MTRWVARLSLLAATLIAGGASYLHALVVVRAADGHGLVAWLIPVLADLVIASGAANLLDAAKSDPPEVPRWSVAAIVVGGLVTVAANIASGNPHAVPAWVVNAWPPIAFGFALESFSGLVRRIRVSTPVRGLVAVAGDAESAAAAAYKATVAAGFPASQNALQAAFKLSRAEARRVVASANGSVPDAT